MTIDSITVVTQGTVSVEGSQEDKTKTRYLTPYMPVLPSGLAAAQETVRMFGLKAESPKRPLGAIDGLPYTDVGAIGPNRIYFNNGSLVGCSTDDGNTAAFVSEEERQTMAKFILTFLHRHYEIKDLPPEFRDFMRVYFNIVTER